MRIWANDKRGKRQTVLSIGGIVATILLGLGIRRNGSLFPHLIAEFAPDTLWAMLVFFLVRVVWSRGTTASVAGIALLLAYCIEFSQLYHAPWIDAIRHTTFGGLVFGFAFLPSDLLCYTLGIGVASVLDAINR